MLIRPQVARWDLLQLHLIESALYCIYTTSSTKLFCILRYWLQCIFLLHLAFSVLHLPKSDLMQNVEHSLLYGCRVNVVFVACCASYFPVAQCLIGMVLVVDYQVARDSVVWDKILPPLSLIPLVPPLSVSLASKITTESFWKQPIVGREQCCNVLKSAPVVHNVEYELSNTTFCGVCQWSKGDGGQGVGCLPYLWHFFMILIMTKVRVMNFEQVGWMLGRMSEQS